MPRLDSQTVLLLSALVVFGLWIFKKSGSSKKNGASQWGPLAGSGPGIQPDVAAHSCPSHQQQRKRDEQQIDVAPYNPASFDFASVQ